jgi:septal ring factor EnvC (AmiA/AmiB activator)
MPAKTVRMPQQTQTEIAVLQVQVKNIEDKVGEIKEDLKSVHDCLDRNSQEMKDLIREMQEADSQAHIALSQKVSALEKWRWMMMGAGIVIGSLGFDTMAKLLK